MVGKVFTDFFLFVLFLLEEFITRGLPHGTPRRDEIEGRKNLPGLAGAGRDQPVSFPSSHHQQSTVPKSPLKGATKAREKGLPDM